MTLEILIKIESLLLVDGTCDGDHKKIFFKNKAFELVF